MPEYGPSINPYLAGHFSNTIFHNEQEFAAFVQANKIHYNVTGQHIADNPHYVHALWNYAQQYDVDPIAGLVKIQQEEGLLSHAYTQSMLDWATGYGATDSGNIDDYMGFDNQVENFYKFVAEKRDEFYNCTNPNCHTITVDGQQFTAESLADYIYYTYTPHSEMGNVINDVLDSQEKPYDFLKEQLAQSGIQTSSYSFSDFYGADVDPSLRPTNEAFYLSGEEEKVQNYLDQNTLTVTNPQNSNAISSNQLVSKPADQSQFVNVMDTPELPNVGTPAYEQLEQQSMQVGTIADLHKPEWYYANTTSNSVSTSFENFQPFPEIYGVPPMTGSRESDSLLLDSMQYIFIRPGISSLDMFMQFSKFEPQPGKFRSVVLDIANEAGIKVAFRSWVGEYLVFAISNPNTYSYTLNNNYGPSFFEEGVRRLQQNSTVGQIIQAAGGTQSALNHGLNMVGKALDYFEALSEVGLTNSKEDMAFKESVQKSTNIAKRNLNAAVRQSRNFFNSKNQTIRTVAELVENFVGNSYLGKRTDMADVWQDSTSSLSYNFTVDLRSISTINESVYHQRVLEPLLVLLSLASPRNFGVTGQSSFAFETPFLVNLKIPGVATVEHGAITDLTVSIESGEMSLKQRPRNIKVTFTIVDLYQVMVMLGMDQWGEIPMISKYLVSTKQSKGINKDTKNVLQKKGNGLLRASLSELSYY